MNHKYLMVRLRAKVAYALYNLSSKIIPGGWERNLYPKIKLIQQEAWESNTRLGSIEPALMELYGYTEIIQEVMEDLRDSKDYSNSDKLRTYVLAVKNQTPYIYYLKDMINQKDKESYHD